MNIWLSLLPTLFLIALLQLCTQKPIIQPNPFIFSSFSLDLFEILCLILHSGGWSTEILLHCGGPGDSVTILVLLWVIYSHKTMFSCVLIYPFFLVWCTFSRSILKRGAWRLRLYLTETSCPLPSHLIEYWVGHNNDSMSKNISSQYLGGNSPLSANYHS